MKMTSFDWWNWYKCMGPSTFIIHLPIKSYSLRPFLHVHFGRKKNCPKLLVHFSFQSNFLYVFSKSNNFQCLTSIYIYTTLSNSLHLLGICMKTRYPTNIFLRCVIFSKGTSKRGRREYLLVAKKTLNIINCS